VGHGVRGLGQTTQQLKLPTRQLVYVGLHTAIRKQSMEWEKSKKKWSTKNAAQSSQGTSLRVGE
jgi:hypothetical protein